jgi:hypothetical protein
MKKILLRIFMGIPIGITIGYLITVVISLGYGEGNYLPCSPFLIEQFGNQSHAVLVQLVLLVILGGGFGGLSIVWEKDEWSLLKQTIVYGVGIAMIMLPIAYFTYWMEHSIRGFFIYFGIFIIVFIIVWFIQYTFWKLRIKKMNAQVHHE